MLEAILFVMAVAVGGAWTAIYGKRLSIPRAAGNAAPWLRLEGLLILAAGMVTYGAFDGSWAWFITLFLLPDIGMLPYLLGRPALGRITYNTTHTHALPLALALGVAGFAIHADGALQVAAMWSAHIGLDRMLGYGLKSGPSFSETHIGRW